MAKAGCFSGNFAAQQSEVRTQSYAREKARGQASRQQACGSLRAEPSIGEAVHKRQTKLVGRTKRPSTSGGKQRRVGVTRREQAPALHVGSADPKAGNSQKKRVLNSREQHSPCAGDELPAKSSRTATASSAVVAQSPAIKRQTLAAVGQQFNG